VSDILIKEIKNPPEPQAAFSTLMRQRSPFFLDSALRMRRLGRYSFVGAEPFLTIRAKGREVTISGEGGERRESGNPFGILRRILAEYDMLGRESQSAAQAPVPFVGGAVGYFAYDLCHHVEKLPDTTIDDINLPDMYFAFYDVMVGYDLFARKCYIIGNPFSRGENIEGRMARLRRSLSRARTRTARLRRTAAGGSIRSNFTKAEYLDAVQACKEYIAAGDIFQVNLSQRFETELKVSPAELYLRLRRINPAPFACYIGFDDMAVVSSSPERFLKVTGRHVETRPIKGTRPRRKSAAFNARMRRELLNSEKDNAELAMIVDLERNDIGRVCSYGTVRVTEPRVLEAHPTVYHLVATVEGELHEGFDIIDLLKACFPGGSITGAPKIRAMEIIDELEPTKRSVYTGAIGYISSNGCMDLNIAIRTFIVNGKRAFFQVGGGIVADSEPESEYDETLDKAKALIQSVSQ